MLLVFARAVFCERRFDPFGYTGDGAVLADFERLPWPVFRGQWP